MSSALDAVKQIAHRAKLREDIPTPVAAEVAALTAAPGIDDPTLRDLTAVPFVTIDYEESRDLDQALFVERDGDGFCVWYALADAAHYVAPGSALFAEAVMRGASFYLPGYTVPMLPRELSEGLVSLNPGVDRRALVFCMRLGADGEVASTELVRGRIHSRAKLTYDGVQAFVDQPASSPIAGTDYAAGLELLGVVGELRIARAEDRNVVRYDRVHPALSIDSAAAHELTIRSVRRNRVQMWNEQISLLTNMEGGRFLAAGGGLGVFKVHPAPDDQELDDFAASVRDLAETLGLDSTWWWVRERESLAEYVDRLPDRGDGWRLARALQRQAMIMGEPSRFTVEPGEHFGIGARPYSRFSAPMREVVGVVTHHLAIAAMAGDDAGIDRETIEAAVLSGNRAQSAQKRITRDANRLAIDQLFAAERAIDRADRPVRTATVMGMTEQKIYLQLDEPPVTVKLYIADQERLRRARFERVNRVHVRCGDLDLRIGDEARVRVRELSRRSDRWVLELVD